MSMKKKTLAVLAAATVAAAAVSITANAVSLGDSAEGMMPFTTDGDEPVSITVLLDSEKYGKTTLTADFEAGMLPKGGYTFIAKSIVLDWCFACDYHFSFDETDVVDYEAVEVKLLDVNGEEIHDVNPVLTLETETGQYNSALIYEGDDFVRISDCFVDGNRIGFVAPHLSRFIFAYLASVEPDPIAPVPEDDKSEPEVVDPTKDDDKSKPDVVDPTDDDKENGGTEKSDAPSDTSNVTPAPTNNDDVKTGDNCNATAAVFIVMGLAALATSIAAVKTGKNTK